MKIKKKPKDRIAAKAKAKRRAVRAAETEEIKKKFYATIENAHRSDGKKLPKGYNRKEAWRIHQEVKWQVFTKAVVSSMVVVADVLSTEHGYGKKRLYDYIEAVKKTVNIVGNNERTIDQLAEELKYDAELDLAELYRDCSLYESISDLDYAKQEAEAVFGLARHGMVIALYTLYNDGNWKKRRMNRIADFARSRLVGALKNDGLEEIISRLSNQKKVSIKMDGRVEVYS